MLHALGIAALLAAAGAPPAEPAQPTVRTRRLVPDALRDWPGWAPRAPPSASSCVADTCPPVVSVPGMSLRPIRPSRTELVAVYLARTNLEPFATVAHGLLVTGLRVDYSPPIHGGRSEAPTRWGSVFVGLKFRLDAANLPVVPRHGR